MQVRAATAHDTQAISTIASQTFALACPPDTPQEELDRYTRENLLPEHFKSTLLVPTKDMRVLEKAGTVIGFSVVDHQPDTLDIAQADGIPELTRCYVLAAFHGTGAAQHLLSATLAAVDTPVRLTVNDQNARAIGFYQRNGFQAVGETRFQCGSDIHRDLVMVRPRA